MGDKNQKAELDTGDKQQAAVINNVQDIPPWFIGVVILLAGWAIPSPTETFRGLRSLFKK